MKYIILLFLFSSCANYQLKNTCEQTNWFQYAQSVANSGRYLEEDSFAKECKSVDRIQYSQADLGFKLGREKMCTYDEMYNRGKDGKQVYFNFCDGLSLNQMKSKYQSGLKVFCTETSGLSYGKSGESYQKVCPAETESSFLKGYKPGRHQYLTLVIKNKKSQLLDLEREYNMSISQENTLNHQYNLIPQTQDCKHVSVYDEAAKKNVIKQVCVEDEMTKRQRGDIISRLNSTRSNSSEILNKQKQIKSEIEKAEHESLTLN